MTDNGVPYVTVNPQGIVTSGEVTTNWFYNQNLNIDVTNMRMLMGTTEVDGRITNSFVVDGVELVPRVLLPIAETIDDEIDALYDSNHTLVCIDYEDRIECVAYVENSKQTLVALTNDYNNLEIIEKLMLFGNCDCIPDKKDLLEHPEYNGGDVYVYKKYDNYTFELFIEAVEGESGSVYLSAEPGDFDDVEDKIYIWKNNEWYYFDRAMYRESNFIMKRLIEKV